MLTEQIIKSSPTSKVAVSVCLVAIVGLATYNWIVSPQTSYLYAARQYEKMVDNAGKKTQIIKNQIKVKEIELEKLTSQITEMENRFFKAESAKEFFLSLEPLALSCGCSIDSLTFITDNAVSKDDDENKDTGISTKHSAVSVTGDYENLVTFLRKLNEYDQRVSVRDLCIESNSNSNEELACDMVVTIYVAEDKETVNND